ncbi:MAG: tRNA (adenosine(37)-N6)-threonylcarbamoyltransferase complex dimerization subunit type 1 TsaB [Bacteroidales bacterium]|nr:tRNA (adenosine(37)-N6)-threonylcarbamoyltransferase complex dimerization subunit type 1 TsaB [Bacteroidales bacterium]
MILCIETSGANCSVALTVGCEVVASRQVEEARHAEVLTPTIEAVMKEAGVQFDGLEAVAVSSGPGSYTGLRIGVSTAKGIAYARRIPLISVPTLEMMAWRLLKETTAETVCPMIDARRMEVYAMIVRRSGEVLVPAEAVIIDGETFGTQLATMKIAFGGDGSDKCKGVITSGNASFVSGVNPTAADMGCLASERLKAGRTEDVAYFEPFYLKEYKAVISKNKVLNQ